jgi:hypothetical protein
MGTANGQAGTNPQRLAEYVEAINAGRRPRARGVLSADYVDRLRRQAADAADELRTQL